MFDFIDTEFLFSITSLIIASLLFVEIGLYTYKEYKKRKNKIPFK